MKTIGLLGGMSWESSAEYYRLINGGIKENLGGLHSAECLLYSVDFARIEELQHRGDWEGLTSLMIDYARSLEKAGAGCVLICTNTMHLMAEEVQDALEVPLLHIADAAGEAVRDSGFSRVGLLGTKFTMEKDFYRGRIKEKFGIDVIIPGDEDRQTVHDTIYKELVLGNINDSSRGKFRAIIDRLAGEGAEGVILGCTEIPLLVKGKDSSLPLFDTTAIHARAAVRWALDQ